MFKKKTCFGCLLLGMLVSLSLFSMISRISNCSCPSPSFPHTPPSQSYTRTPTPHPPNITLPHPHPTHLPLTSPRTSPSTQNRTPPTSLSSLVNVTHYRFCLVSSNNTVLLNKSFEGRTHAVFPALLSNHSATKIDLAQIARGQTFLTKTSAKNLTLKEIFRPSITAKEKLISLYVFQIFIDMCRQYNITFFLYEGALMGSYRHGGFVPWDDDIDIFVNASQREVLKKAADAYSSQGFKLFTHKSFQWKFYHNIVSKGYSHKPFRWPYIDIFFWTTDNDSFYDFTHNIKESKLDLKIIIPLKTCPFEGLLLPCPADTKKYLDSRYTTNTCKTNSYSHKYETSMPWQKSVPCKDLKDIFKFSPKM